MSSYPVPRPARDLIAQWAEVDNPAVIFDFNGTLSDDEPILFRIFGELFGEHLNWAMTAEDYDRHLLGHSDREIVEKALQITGIDVARRPPAGVAQAPLPGTGRRPQPHHRRDRGPGSRRSPNTTCRWRSSPAPSATTSGPSCESSPVGEVITVVVAEEDVRRGKPDPEGFLAGAAALDRTAGRRGGVRGLGAGSARRAGRRHALHRRRRAAQPGGADGGAGRGAAPVTRSRLARAAACCEVQDAGDVSTRAWVSRSSQDLTRMRLRSERK